MGAASGTSGRPSSGPASRPPAGAPSRPPQGSRPGGYNGRPPGGSGPSGPRPGVQPGFGAGYAAGYNAARSSGEGRPGKQNAGRRPQASQQSRPKPQQSRPKKKKAKNGGGSGIFKIIAVIVVIAVIIMAGRSFLSDPSAGVTKSTHNRQKLDGNKTYHSKCVVDSLGWLDDVQATQEGLRHFYDTTGVQPYVVFLPYDSELKNNKQKEKYVREWYKDHIKDENTFVYMYFGTDHEGEGDPGYMTYAQGKRVNSIMDDEAMEIFWDYLDKNWISDQTESDVIVNTFTETADRIMTRTRTSSDVLIWLIIAVIVLGGLVLIIRIRNQKRRHEAERAKETEQILNTPLEKSRDELLEKYTKK